MKAKLGKRKRKRTTSQWFWDNPDFTPGVDIYKLAREHLRKENEQKEQFILDFFGDEETARALAHLYEIHEYPVDIYNGQGELTRQITYKLVKKEGA